jgi:hypothetical protein
MSGVHGHAASVRQGAKAERAMFMAERARCAGAWAEAHADRGDYEHALKWLDLVRKSSGGLSPRQQEHRRLWRRALEAGRPGERPARPQPAP